MAAAWLGHSTCPMPSYLHHPSPPLHAVRYLERFSFFLSLRRKGKKHLAFWAESLRRCGTFFFCFKNMSELFDGSI